MSDEQLCDRMQVLATTFGGSVVGGAISASIGLGDVPTLLLCVAGMMGGCLLALRNIDKRRGR